MSGYRTVRLASWFVSCVLVGVPHRAAAQVADSSLITLDRLYASRDFIEERFGPARWLADGKGYATLESPAQGGGGSDLVRYDAATGARTVLVPASRLIPAGDSVPLEIEDYGFSADGGKVLIFTNSRRVWRENTRGDFWVLNLQSWKLRKLGGKAPPSTLMFAKFSPDGGRVAYVREHNLYVERLDTGRITQLTRDGSTTIINGTFDWVYEEEFGDRDGFRWSPDGTRLAYWQLDAAGVRDFLLINNTDSLYSYVIPVQYPKAGTTNSAARVGVVAATGGITRWLKVPGDPRNNYLPRMDWAANSRELILQHLNRLQNTDEVLLAEVATGRLRTVLTEQDTTWVEVVDDLRWLDGGKRFTWVSERDGWRHVWLISRDGRERTLLTPGAFDVAEVAQIDEAGGWLYYVASPDNPTQRYLFRVRLDGSGQAERISPITQRGTHGYDIGPGARWAIHRYSSFGVPPITDLVSLPEHAVVRTLAGNERLRHAVELLKKGPADFFRVEASDGVALDGYVMRPIDFDSTRRYPVLFTVYGEPAGQTAVDAWGFSTYLWHLMLTQKGYAVVTLDNRGTPSLRGREWRKAVYRKIGVIASAEQASAAQAIGRWPWVDSTRMGIWGWSGGGSMTLNLMFRSPDVYKMGMAVAPVPDMRYYDTIYQERYMGLPQDNAEDYRQGSPITFADQLKGDLLIVHGTGDDNVHYQGTEALINRLIAANKPFTMMAYPNRTHGIFEGKNTTRHLFGLLTRYVMEHL